VALPDRSEKPHEACVEATRQTSVPGLFLAGRVCAGDDGNRIFIENGREHGAAIVACLAERTGRS
jgi:thioredoxin reductase (NADPH)